MTIEEYTIEYCNNDPDKYEYVLGELAVQLGRELDDEITDINELKELVEYILLDIFDEEDEE